MYAAFCKFEDTIKNKSKDKKINSIQYGFLQIYLTLPLVLKMTVIVDINKFKLIFEVL